MRASSTAARDVEDGAGYVGRRVTDQPKDRLADLVGRAGAAEWRRDAQLVGAVGLAAAGVDLGVDQAGADAVDAHAFGTKLLGEADGHGVDGALGGGVVDIFASRSQPRGGRGDIDDRTAFAAAFGRHAA